ncbi:TPA: DUF4400 domain-containing protein [Vibrio parahaemolyticus]|uniref:DUF4400 domain-containing protein n=1 Tax=Vibrio harveyi group TaxID=717610 RepID=UPI0018F26592|nr:MULTISPECIES: DUF4400 domain-containing protein [Vibrio harveyi group]MCR9909680.1 DUF4400 domain-containing protein [Vibrio campbellii]UPR19064.1 DUF4400 domain-containing protein [Vibrio parahaemolyticus]HAV1520155.1 DUF4400 domain-containing protein [Vibrio parahaemolyticus]HAV1539122.1 DUF4400 domain-containing protein [Vibrio parahaemolyticus]
MSRPQTNSRAERPQPKTAERSASEQNGVVVSILEFPCLVLKTLSFSLLISILIALVGVTWIWPDEGVSHELRTLEQELSELAFELRDFGSGFSAWVEATVSQMMNWPWFAKTIGQAVTWAFGFFSEEAVMYGQVTYYATLIFIVRLGVILSSVPILFIWILIGAVCGLTERDLRRHNAALESSTVFNLAVTHVKLPFLLCVTIYLSFPTRAYAILATLPVCLGSFLLIYLAIGHYKKRL